MEFCHGRDAAGGHFIWYNSWERKCLPSEEARAPRESPPSLPLDHPIGYHYLAEVLGEEVEKKPAEESL